jgi:hypothetical protein
MRKVFFLLVTITFVACGGGTEDSGSDTTSAIRDTSLSSPVMNADTTSVLGANHIGEGQMRTDTPMSGGNVGK